MAKVIAPNAKFNGEAYGIHFVNGISETEDKWTLNLLKEVGCEIENKPAKAKKEAPKE